MEHQQTAGEIEHSRAVRKMFSGIAGRYDLLNHLLSANIDKRWRKKVRQILQDKLDDPDALILDVACGTGDLSIELSGNARANVLGTDFCRPMLEVAQKKAPGIPFTEGDAMSLPFPDKTFDAVTIAFGLRNLPNFNAGLAELRRVLKTDGKLAVLEFSSPVVPGFRGLFNFYFANVLPRLGGLVSGERGAYEYLPASVQKFPDQKALVKMIAETGFSEVSYTNLTGGIAAIHVATRSDA